MKDKDNVIKSIKTFNQTKPRDVLYHEYEWHQLAQVINSAISDEPSVPLTVEGRNRFFGMYKIAEDDLESKRELSLEIDITIEEAEVLKDYIMFGLEFYGKPAFDYFAVDRDRWEDVDYWRNVLKIGRFTGKGAGEKRVAELNERLNDPKTGTWNPNWNHINVATKRLSAVWSDGIVDRGRVTDEVFSTEKSTTNSGVPWFKRKSKELDGIPIRQLIASRAKSLSLEEVTTLRYFLGARAQTGKWHIMSGEDPQDFINRIVSLNEGAMLKEIFANVRFWNFKTRIIMASSSIAAYIAAPVISEMNKLDRLRKEVSAMRFLDGPEAVRETLLKMRHTVKIVKEKLGITLEFFNADAEAYDSTNRSYHAQLAYNAAEPVIPRFRDKRLFEMQLISGYSGPMLYSEQPIDMKQKSVRQQVKTAWFEGLRSGSPITNRTGSDIMRITSDAAQRQINDKWEQIIDISVRDAGVFPLQVCGDDNNTLFEVGVDGTIKSSLQKFAEVQNEQHSLVYHNATEKGELGPFFGQYRLTDDDRFITPISRMKIYWSETSKTALPPYVYVLKHYQNLEYRWQCKGIIKFIIKFMLPYDKTKLGMVDINTGKRINVQQFIRKLSEHEEQDSQDRTVVDMLFKGNPYDTTMLSQDGTKVSSEWINTQYSKISAAYDEYLNVVKVAKDE